MQPQSKKNQDQYDFTKGFDHGFDKYETYTKNKNSYKKAKTSKYSSHG